MIVSLLDINQISYTHFRSLTKISVNLSPKFKKIVSKFKLLEIYLLTIVRKNIIMKRLKMVIVINLENQVKTNKISQNSNKSYLKRLYPDLVLKKN